MVDVNKVMKGLECCKECTQDDPFQLCDECPYNDISIAVQDCRAVLSAEALELLKEQKQKIEVLTVFSKASGIDTDALFKDSDGR